VYPKLRERPPAAEKPSSWEIYLRSLREDILDLRRCLAGDQSSERWKKLKIELDNMEQEINSQIEIIRRRGDPSTYEAFKYLAV